MTPTSSAVDTSKSPNAGLAIGGFDIKLVGQAEVFVIKPRIYLLYTCSLPSVSPSIL